MSAERMKAAAQAYAERLGFYVFPVGADARTPFKVEGAYERGVRDATNDPAEIARRWSRHRGANIALACGSRSGVFALDIDAKVSGKATVNGFESLARLEAEFGPLPETWRSVTPSGGEHRFFRQPEGVVLRNKVGLRVYDSRGRMAAVYEGLDIRTDGGSTALPPSRKPHGEYRWVLKPSAMPAADAPPWLLRLAMDPPRPLKRDRPPLRRDDTLGRYVEKAVDGECGAVAATKSGRNVRLFQAAIRLGELVGAGLLSQSIAEDELTDAAGACGLLQEDGLHAIRQTIASGMRKGIAQPREVKPREPAR